MKRLTKLLPVLLIAVCPVSVTAAIEFQPTRLRCEYLVDPLGIDAIRPRLSWEFPSKPDGPRGMRQTAYQVLVASIEALLQEGKPDLWDSGKIVSDETIGIEYAGRELRSGEQCYWKVRTWDQGGKVSEWSKPDFWTMGLLDASDWLAKWIGAPANAAQSSRFYRDWKRRVPAPSDVAPSRVPDGPEVHAWIESTKVNAAYGMPKGFDGLKYSQERLEELQPAPLLRREFNVTAPVNRATIYLCGLGCYQLRLNGKNLDERVLDPAQTDYDVRAFYTTFDVTDSLHTGKNAIGVVLGDGWYRQTLTFTHLKQPAAFGRPGLLLQMEIEYADGRVERIISNDQWKCSVEGPLVKNAVYAGELYDARREMPGWDAPAFDEKDWASVEVIPPLTPRVQSQMIPPIRVVETVKPVALSNPKPGVWVCDMGVQLTGNVRLHTDAPPGTAITLKFAETLDHDGLAHQPGSLNMGAKGVDMYVCRGGKATWEPQFTYHSFRYVQVEGLSDKPPLDMLEGRFVTQDLEPALEFQCSNDLLNRVHTAFVRTGMQNAQHKWTDCPSREKRGWVGYPLHMIMAYNFDAYPFLGKIVEEMGIKTFTMKVNSKPYPGVCRTIIPSADSTSMATGIHGVLLPWELYLQYGDRRLLEKIYPVMRSTFLWNAACLTPDGVGDCWIGDWHDALPGYEEKYIQLRKDAAKRTGKTGGGGQSVNSDPGPTITARLYQAAQYMVAAARALNKPEAEIREYEQIANRIKEGFIKVFYKSDELAYGSQTSDAYALCLDLLPPGKENQVLDSLVSDVMVTRKGHFSTGEFGTDRLLEALTIKNRDDVACALMTKEDFPSFGLMLAQGSTTTWETWGEAILSTSKSGKPELVAATRPVSHAQFLAADGWFLKDIAGIRRDESSVGFKSIILRPHLFRQLDWEKADFHSIRGVITSDWKRQGDRFSWKVVVPPNTTAMAFVPTKNAASVLEGSQAAGKSTGVKFLREEDGAAVFELQSGNYNFQSLL